MAGQWWESAPKVDPFEAAISLEGLDPTRAAIARSIYQQESSSGRNTATSNAGAVGGMQIIPGTFNRMADKGWNINDELDNARAGVRYVNKLYDLADGDPRLTAAGYYGGEGAIPKAKAGQAVSDPRNPNAPNTLQYADQVAGRLAPAQVDDSWWKNAPLAEPEGDATTSRGPDGVMRVEMGGTAPAAQAPVSDNSLVALGAGLGSGVGQVALGAQEWLGKGMRGLGMDQAGNWLVDDAQAGRKRLAGEVAPYKEVSPWAAGGGELAGNIAATLPVGGVLGRGVSAITPNLGRVAPQAEKLANALRSGGMNLGGAPAATVAGQVGNIATRMAGGAGTGAVSAGLVDPESAGTGAVVGAAFPLAGVALARGGHAIGNMLRGGEVSAPVRDLANRAAELGIKVPADRIVNSRPMNAMAASLNYVPFSGRAAVEDTMQSQLNRALSKTFGQDSTNVTQALRAAAGDLGQKFDDVLKSNLVKVDDDFLGALAERSSQALQELPEAQAKIINTQIDAMIEQAAKNGGQLDGQLAYNFKRTLDRIGQRNTPEAFYANELKRDLMGALNRSLGAKEAEAFARVRQQYGNMLSLENLAKNGVDGDISIARLANMRNIRNPELQELADIAAQFLRPREGQHGAAQRIMAGALMGYGAGIPAAAASVGVGRMANSLLNSTAARNAMLGQQSNSALANALRQALPVTAARTAPVISAQ
ncbi:Transglycosylase SLT domain protein [compost metagenome]